MFKKADKGESEISQNGIFATMLCVVFDIFNV